MSAVEIANLQKPIAVALDWHLLPGATSERKEIDALAKLTGSKFGCVLNEDQSGLTMVGVCADKMEGVNCGAAWLARAAGAEALVLVEPLGDGRIWMCAVRARLPVQGMDIVIETSQLHERLREFLSDGEAKLCSTLENLEQVYPNVLPQSFAELVANTKPARIRRIAGIRPAVTVTAAILVAAFGGWYGADYYFTNLRQQEAQAKVRQLNALQRQQEAERIAAAKRERIETAQAKIRQVVLEKPAVAALVRAYLDELGGKPLTLSGWALASYDCSNMTCLLSWQRHALGTIVGFLQAAEHNGWVVNRVEGNEAVTSHPLRAAPRTNTIDDLSEDGPFRAALESRLQQAAVNGLRYEMSKSEPLDKLIGRAEPGASIPANPSPALEPLPYLVGTLTVKGSTFFELRELPDYIAHPGLSVKNVRGDLKANQWTMEFNYATR